jgi:hypothetical protein
VVPTQKVIWSTSVDPVSEDRITAVQKTLGVRLPESFLEIVRKWNGGQAEPDCFLYFDTQDNEWDQTSVGLLLDFREPMDKYLKQIYRHDKDLWTDMDIQPWWTIEDHNVLERPDHFTPGLISFADDGGSNFSCFDYRAGTDNPDPPIVFWHHEFHSSGEEPFYVAKNFREFLALLRPCMELVSAIQAAGRARMRE